MRVTSLENKEIKYLRNLSRRRVRERENRIVVEGIRSIRDAADKGVKIYSLYYSISLFRSREGRSLLERLREEGVREIEVADSLMKQLSGTETPQGIIAIVEKKLSTLEEVINKPEAFLLLIDQVQDPGNLGTIIRTAAAADLTGLILTKGTVDPYSPKVLRSTMSAIFDLAIVEVEDVKALIAELKSRKIRIIATSPKGDKYYYLADYSQPLALVVGNEARGLDEGILRSADEVIKVPLLGKVESLNVAVATSIIIYEAIRQRMVG